jgi:tetratricopeptide (TPR) repeat protein
MANELVIADTYYNRTTAMGFGYRGFQENLVKTQTGEITATMRENSKREIAATIASAGMVAESVRRMETGITTAIDGQTEVLSNTLEAGFGRVTDQLGRMSAEMNLGFARTEAAIDRLSDEICQRLDKIANILETPRGTAARELFNNAFTNYRKGFYEEALPDVQKAVELLTADYLSWFLEGNIYAFGAGEFSNVIDLDKAIAAYTSAAKYISPDAEKAEETKRLAAEIRFYLGLAQYARSNELFRAGNQADSDTLLSAARDSFLRSYQYSPLMLEARYNAARCKALLGDTPGALADLEAVIKEDPLYCVKAEIESDFDIIRGDYHRLIEKMRVELYGEAAPVYKEIADGYNLAKQEGLTRYFERTVSYNLAKQDGLTQCFEKTVISAEDIKELRAKAGVSLIDSKNALEETGGDFARAEKLLKEKRLAPIFNFNRSGITSSGIAGYGIGLINTATIPLFEQCISAGFDKSLPYLDMRVRIPPYPALLNVLKKGMAVFQTAENNDGSVTIVKYGGADTQVIIPASIGGKPVTAIGEKAFEQKQLTGVMIPNSVKTIGDNAFLNNQLTSVVFGNSVITIGRGAFYNNQLTSIAIPDSVTTIGDDAFSGKHSSDVFIHNKLTSVTIGNRVTTIGKGAFAANQLTSVVIPNSVKTIGDSAFSTDYTYLTRLKDVIIGANVNVGKWDEKTRFDSCYNGKGKKAGKYYNRESDWYSEEENRKDSRWMAIGALLGLVPLIGGFVVGHWVIGILVGIAAAVVGAVAFLARGWGIFALALIGGGIVLGIHLEHPFIGGIIAVIVGLVVWGVGVSKR